MLAVALSAGGLCQWQPAPLRHPHGELIQTVETITSRSILDHDLEPLVAALPQHLVNTADERRRIEARAEAGLDELRRRLGPVADWEVAEVLTDEAGRVKVRVRFYRDRAGTAAKRPYRGVSFIFQSVGRRPSLVWVGFWDPETGSWDVIGDS